jgi:cytochrome c553
MMKRSSWPAGLAAVVISAITCALACNAPPLGVDGRAQPRGGSDGKGESDMATDPSGEHQQTTTGLPCAVSEVLSATCQTCHSSTPKSGASTALVTWDDLQKDYRGKKLYEAVKDRIHAEAGRMPPAARLTDAQVKSIDDWVAAGAPKAGDTCDVGGGPPPPTSPFTCDAPNKLTVLKAASPFTWTDTSSSDQYMCFGVDEIVGAKRHVIAMGPKIDNLNIVHHVLLFQSKDAMSNEATPCGATTSAQWKMVTGWAPGGKNFELPPEAGYPEEGTTHWILQVHYNNATGQHTGESDQSGYQLCSTDQLRANDAGTLAFGSTHFSIPPRTAKWGIRCDYQLRSKYQGVKFFAATPHMHKLGLGVMTERIPGGTGSPQVVFGQTPFSFENQEAAKIDVSVEDGDIMRTHCTWKNTGDTAVTWGENTSDEMCFNFLNYYPAIPDESVGPVPIQTWITPSLPVPLVGADCEEEN